MAKDELEKADLADDEPKSSLDEAKPLFSQDEVENTVKGFLLAWMRGELTVHFPTSDDIHSLSVAQGKPITLQEAKAKEHENKKEFTNLIEVCSGRTPASPAELEKATTSLFRYIMWWRQGERIEGKFLEYSIEEKMNELERKLEATNRIVIEFIKWYRGSTSGESVPKM